MLILSPVLLSLAACITAASCQQPRLVRPPAASIGRRQVTITAPSPMPSQCTSTCSPVSNEVSLGCPVTACCTTTFETQYYNCLECVGMALDVANYSTAQNSLNLLYTTCVDMGFVLPRLELPGQTNASATTTGAATATATGAAVGLRWYGGQVQALFGAAVLLGLVGLL